MRPLAAFATAKLADVVWEATRSHSDSVLTRVAAEGFAVLPEWLPIGDARRMLDAAPDWRRLSLSPDKTLTRLLHDADTHPAFQPFFGDAWLNASARALIRGKALNLRRTLQRRHIKGVTGSFDQFFHFDTWRQRFKFFLYLTDVGPQNAPLVYAPRTHRGLWRMRHELDLLSHTSIQANGYLAGDASLYAGALFPHQAARLFDRLGVAPVELTAPAGSLVIFDARGFHRSRPLEAGERTILSSYWIRDKAHI